VAPRGRAAADRLVGPKDASPELREALTSPVGVSSLPVAATAAFFKGPEPNASVVVSTLVGGRDLPLAEKDGTFVNDLEFAVSATSIDGKSYGGDRSTVTLSLKPDTMRRLRLGGFRAITSIDLPPGRYQLRVAAREGNTKRAGSVLYDLDIPDFRKEPLLISSLALTSASSAITPTVRPKDPLAKLLPGPLTTYREFSQNDEVAVFTEVYEAKAGQPHKVDISLSVKAEGGATVFSTREERDSSELQGNAGGYGFSARIPLRKFDPGLYVLRVEAQSRIEERPTVVRETVFRVIPASGPAPTSSASAAGPAPAASPGDSGAGAAAEAANAARATPPGAAASKPAPPSDAQELPITPLAGDQMSAIDSARQVVAKTQAEYDALWREHAPGRAAPPVDFSRNMVVAVFLGSRPSAGFEVQITRVQREGDAAVVTWAERRPGRDQIAAQVMTAPAHIVSVPRVDGTVRFVKASGE
jgi:hypothetical protein